MYRSRSGASETPFLLGFPGRDDKFMVAVAMIRYFCGGCGGVLIPVAFSDGVCYLLVDRAAII